MKVRTRLTTDQKMRALALLARGDTLSQVAAHLLEYYQVTVSESGLSQIRSNNKETISQMQQVIADGQSAEAEAIANRARRLINNKLDRAERDVNSASTDSDKAKAAKRMEAAKALVAAL